MSTFWAFYFLAKSYLYFQGLMQLRVGWNAALLALVLWPIYKERRRGLKLLWQARAAAALALGAFLLWRDGMPLRSSPGSFDLFDAMVLVGVLTACEFMARRGYRPMTLAVVLFAAVAVKDLGAASQAVALRAAEFYGAQSSRVVRFVRAAQGPPFDVVILHVGSLSWADLVASERLRHPLLDRFDYLFTNFNSVSSYNSPSALRLLRANCGQVRHDELYKPWPKECSLLDALRVKGYRAFTVFNHADKSGLGRELRQRAMAEAPDGLQGLSLKLINWDGTPVAGDFDAMSRWWKLRQQSGVAKAVLYYNTVTLQNGAHEPNPSWWRESPVSRYRRRLDALSRDLDEFYALLDASGRNVVVFFVPEHGQGLRGDSAFARDVPTPQFTHVPVGIKLIGQGRRGIAPRQIVNASAISYLALAQVLGAYLQVPPFGERAESKGDEALSRLPVIDFLAENESARYLRVGADSYVFEKERKWIKLRSKSSRLEAAELASLRP